MTAQDRLKAAADAVMRKVTVEPSRGDEVCTHVGEIEHVMEGEGTVRVGARKFCCTVASWMVVHGETENDVMVFECRGVGADQRLVYLVALRDAENRCTWTYDPETRTLQTLLTRMMVVLRGMNYAQRQWLSVPAGIRGRQ